MKKIFKTYIWVVVAALGVFCGSCNDWLEVKPQSQAESDDLFTSEKGFEDALIACYIKMTNANLYGQNMTMTFIEYLAQHWDFTSGNGRDAALLKNFEYDGTNAETTIRAIYGAYYNTITQANVVLENLQTSGEVIQDENLRNVIEAEALSVRAFCHTDVLRLFGQLPNNPTVTVSLPYSKQVSTDMVPYYTYDEFVQLILQDIEAAQALFKESDPVMDYTFNKLDQGLQVEDPADVSTTFMLYRRFRFNYWAVEALKARLYLYIGDETNARTAANSVINAKTTAGEPILTLSGTEGFVNKCYACPSECLLALSNLDLEDRTRSLFYYNGHFLTPAHFDELFAGQSEDNNNRMAYVWEEEANNQGNTFRDFRKYDQPEDITGYSTSYQLVPLLRLSEMYLIAMETATDITEANALYKTYMEARGVIAGDLTEAELTTEVQNEYRRELFGEGQMFFFYKRQGARQMLWKSDREVVEQDYIVPLPSTELSYN